MRFPRSRKGAVLAEGAVAMVLISGLVTGGILLLTNAGSLFYYKTKLAAAAESGARFGTESVEWLGAPRPGVTDSSLRADVTEVVNETLHQMGLPPASNVQVTRQTVGTKRYLRVKVSVSGLKILSGGILPSQITLDDTAASVFSNSTPPAVLGLTIGTSPNGKGYYIPIFAGTGFASNPPVTFPAGRIRYFAAGVQAIDSNIAAEPRMIH